MPLTNVYGAAALPAFAPVLVFAVILRTISARAGGKGPMPAQRSGGTGPKPGRRATDGPQRRRTDHRWDAAALAAVSSGMDGLVRVLVFRDGYERARRMVSWVL